MHKWRGRCHRMSMCYAIITQRMTKTFLNANSNFGSFLSLSFSLCSLHNHVCVCGVVHSSVIWMWIISFFVPRCWRLILFSAMANFMINIYFSWNELWLVAKHGVYTTWDKVLNNHNPTFYNLIEQCCGEQKKNINFFFLNSIHYRRINENAKKN